jgi:hypothetical protein
VRVQQAAVIMRRGSETASRRHDEATSRVGAEVVVQRRVRKTTRQRNEAGTRREGGTSAL